MSAPAREILDITREDQRNAYITSISLVEHLGVVERRIFEQEGGDSDVYTSFGAIVAGLGKLASHDKLSFPDAFELEEIRPVLAALADRASSTTDLPERPHDAVLLGAVAGVRNLFDVIIGLKPTS